MSDMTKINPLVLISGLKVVHNKTGNHYVVVNTCKNCTNAQDGQLMVIYKRAPYCQQLFCREVNEFCEKFSIYEED